MSIKHIQAPNRVTTDLLRLCLLSGPGNARTPPEVTILMGLHNGAAYLGPQLESFAAQKGVRWQLIVGMDKVCPTSHALLEVFHRTGARISLYDGPRKGHAANFLSLLTCLPESPGLVAFSDQDDVWLPGKLARAAAALAEVPRGQPALYCARTFVTDAQTANRRVSREFRKAPSFRNALVQSIAGGNTMVLNEAAASLAREAAPEAAGIVAHDWWLYQLITAVGGTVIYDPVPALLYRQHGQNAVGANMGPRAALRRLRQVFSGRFSEWTRAHRRALLASAHRFTPEAQAQLGDFVSIGRGGLAAARALFRLRPVRQHLPGTVLIWIAAVLGRL